MLAFAGLVVQEFVHLPGDLYSEPNAIKAFYQVCQAAPVCQASLHAMHQVALRTV